MARHVGTCGGECEASHCGGAGCLSSAGVEARDGACPLKLGACGGDRRWRKHVRWREYIISEIAWLAGGDAEIVPDKFVASACKGRVLYAMMERAKGAAGLT